MFILLLMYLKSCVLGMGSDAGAVTTKATKNGLTYLINGTKFWTTNGIESSGLVVFASTDISKKHKGISSFLVKKDFPGKFVLFSVSRYVYVSIE